MASRLADRLSAARHRRFVGRMAERALFQSALTEPVLPFQVLYVFGPGGVGKTSLLAEFALICEQARVLALSIDGRNVEPSPDSFVGALQGALGLKPPASPLAALGARTERAVILIDTYEALAPLDGWLRDLFLPQIAADVLVVLAGRNAPAPAWRVDSGWQTLIHTLPLRNLNPDESLST